MLIPISPFIPLQFFRVTQLGRFNGFTAEFLDVKSDI